MRIALYAPFKPLDHPNPSGDLVIGNGIKDFLIKHQHQVIVPSRLRSRWIYWKPIQYTQALIERKSVSQTLENFEPDLWLTYHTYYKAPDIIGPYICKKAGIPYVIFQGIYSTKRRRSIKTLPGFHLNRRALLQAQHIFTNRRQDHENLKRLIPEHTLSYIAPGIYPKQFCYDTTAGDTFRSKWNLGDKPTLLSAAMFRPDVKTKGLLFLFDALSRLTETDFTLVIAGDGSERALLEEKANQTLPGKVLFVGKLPRSKMAQFYSAGDIFVFPGIRESLGMVFLEAQSCGVPVIAFDNGGIPEVVKHGKTGLLSEPYDTAAYAANIKNLLLNSSMRNTFSRNAMNSIRQDHNLDINYQQMEQTLSLIISNFKRCS